MNVGEIFRKAALFHGDRTAITSAAGQMTHATVLDRACRLANALAAQGVVPGDRVAVLAGANLASLEQIGGLAIGGYIRVPLNETLGADLHLRLIAACGARVLITDRANHAALRDRLTDIPDLACVIVQDADDPGQDYEALLAAAPSDDPRVAIRDDDIVHIAFTSGTTSGPKALAHMHRGVLGTTWEHLVLLPDLGPDDRYLAAMPLQSFSVLAFPFLLRGGSIHVVPAFDPVNLPATLADQAITVTWLFPTLLERLAERVVAQGHDLSRLRAVFSAGGALSGRSLRRITDALGDVLFLGYGQAEANPATMLTPAMIRAGLDGDTGLLGSSGRVAEGAAVRILDDAGRDLPPGRLGHIVIDTSGTMKGIWNAPEATAARFTPDGFLRTGDVGHLDNRGLLHVAGRATEMIATPTGPVSPVVIEDAFMRHPQVHEVAAYGMPATGAEGAVLQAVHVALCLDAAMGDAGVPPLDGPALQLWARQHLDPALWPEKVTVRTTPLPRNPVGKLLRAELADGTG